MSHPVRVGGRTARADPGERSCFYEKHVPEDPLLAAAFGQMPPDQPQRLTAWLAEVFGGPGHRERRRCRRQ